MAKHKSGMENSSPLWLEFCFPWDASKSWSSERERHSRTKPWALRTHSLDAATTQKRTERKITCATWWVRWLSAASTIGVLLMTLS